MQKEIRPYWIVCAIASLLSLAGCYSGVSASADIYTQALHKHQEVESCFNELDKYVPEVQVHDYLALARTAMQHAGNARRTGQLEESERYSEQAVRWYGKLIDSHVKFASTMINVAEDIKPLRTQYKTLPEFYRRHSHPTAQADAIDLYLESGKAPRPKWIWYRNEEFFESDLFAIKNSKQMKNLKVRVARYHLNLREPVIRAWVQVEFTHGGHVSVNGKDASGWISQDERKFAITEHLGPGRNTIAIKFFQPASNFGTGLIVRGGVELKSGKIIPIISGSGVCAGSPRPGEDIKAAPGEWCSGDFDDSKWESPPLREIGNDTPFIEFRRGSRPELSCRVVTGHSRWAKPLPTGPVRVLGICFWPGAREFVELAQRLDCELNVFDGATWSSVYDNLGLLQKLNKPFDVAVVGGLPWRGIGSEARAEIIKRVKEGAALVYVNNAGGLRDLKKEADFGKAVVEAQENIAGSVPLELITRLKDVGAKSSPGSSPLAACYKVGHGRVVVLTYPKRTRPYNPKRNRSFNMVITPNTFHYPETLPVDYDYYMSLVSKAVVWAAKRETKLSWNSLYDKKSSAFVVRIDKSDKKSDIINVRIRIRSRIYGQIHEQTVKTRSEGSQLVAKFDLPKLPAGEYFADQWIDVDKRVADWRTTGITIKSSGIIESVAAPQVAQESGNDVSFKIVLSKDLPAGHSLIAELVDFNHRIVARRKLDAAGREISVSLPLTEKTTNVMFARASLVSGKSVVESVQDRFGVRQKWDGDFLWGGWPSYGNPCEMVFYQQWQYLKKIGINGMIPTNMNRIPELWVKAVELDLFNVPYPLTIRQLFLIDEQKKEKFEKHKIIETAKIFAPYGPLAYSLGDDVYLSKTHGETKEYRRAYISFLKRKYGNKIIALNQSWGTKLGGWGEIVPLADSKQKGGAWDPGTIGVTEFGSDVGKLSARWMDETIFQEKEFGKSFGLVKSAILKKDPKAKFATEGIINRGYGGVNWPQWCKSYLIKGGYPDKVAWSYSSPYFSSPETLTCQWYGAYGRKQQGWHRWLAWRFALLKHHGLLWFCFKRGGNAHSISGAYSLQWPDYRMKEYGYSAGADIRWLGRGLGKLLFHAKPKYDSIAIMYSVPSERMTRSGSKLGWTLTAQGAWYELLEDIGLMPHWVTGEEVGKNKLDRLGAKVLILPRTICLSDETSKSIKNFVERGGMVIADLRPGVRNDSGNVVSGGQLGTLFGAQWPNHVENHEKCNALGMEGVFVDPGIKLTHGKPSSKANDVPVWIERNFGKGNATLLNFSVANYTGGNRRQRSYGYKNNEAGRRSMKMRELFRGYLSKGGVTADVSLAEGKKSLPAILKTFNIGNGKLLGILRPGPWGAGKYSGGRNVTVDFGDAAHIYDINRSMYLGKKKSITYDVPNDSGQMFAMLPYRVDGINLHLGCNKLSLGDYIRFEASIKADTPEFASHILYVVLRDPSGKIHSRKKLLTQSGTCSGGFQLAFNDSEGTWMLTVTDTVTGLAKSASLKVKQVPYHFCKKNAIAFP